MSQTHNKAVIFAVLLLTLAAFIVVVDARTFPEESSPIKQTSIIQPEIVIANNFRPIEEIYQQKGLYQTLISPLNETINITYDNADNASKNQIKMDSELQNIVNNLNISSSQHQLSIMSQTQPVATSNKINVFVKMTRNLTEEDLNKLGNIGSVFQKVNDTVFTFNNYYWIEIPADSLDKLKDFDFVEYIDSGLRKSIPPLDVSVQRIGGTIVWGKLDNLNKNITGSGILVADIDTGVDFSNPVFSYTNGTSKIRKIIDLTTGEICNRVNLALCNEKDMNGHGTNMAGIIIGGNSGDTYVGVAPNSELLMIKSDGSDSENIQGIISAVNEGAKVILIEFGGWVDSPRDGSTALESTIDWATTQNVTVVVPAGNLGGSGYHASIMAVNGNYTQFRMSLTNPNVDSAWFTFLSPNPNKNIGFWVQPPGANTSIFLGTFKGTNSSCSISQTGIYYCPSSSISPRNTSEFDVYFNKNVLPTGTWYFWLDAINYPISSSQQIEAYTDFDKCSWSGCGQFLDNANDYYIITSPATADTAIAVGSFISKSGSPSGGSVGSISSFSGIGPRIDGVEKPNIVAPGQIIISALSKDATSPWSDNCINILGTYMQVPCKLDSYHAISQGTSPAGPHVAGAVALLMQQDPTLQPYQVKNILGQTTESISTCSGIAQCGNGLVRSDNAYNRIFNLSWHGNSSQYVNLGVFNISAFLVNSNPVSGTNFINTVSLLNSSGIQFAAGETGNDAIYYYPSGLIDLFYYRINATNLGRYFTRFNLITDNMGNHYLPINFTVAMLNLSINKNKNVINLNDILTFNTSIFFNDGTQLLAENVPIINYTIKDSFGNTYLSGTMNNNGTGFYTQSLVLSPSLPKQTYYLNVTATDSNGINGNSITSFVFSQTPIITIFSPLNQTYYNSSIVFFNTYAGGTAKWIRVSTDASSNISCSDCSALAYNLTSLSEGTHNTTVYASDYANEENSSTVMFTVDTIAPFINNVNFNHYGNYITDKVTYILNYSEMNPDYISMICYYNISNVSDVYSYTDNSISSGINKIWNNTIDLSNRAEGSKIDYCQIMIYDKTGKYGIWVDANDYFIHRTPPYYSSLAQTPPMNPNYGQTIQLNSTWSDIAGVSNIFLESNFTGTWQNYTASNQSSTYYYILPVLNAGKTVLWRFIGNDTLNNWNMTMPYQNFTIQKSPISIKLLLGGIEDNKTYEKGQSVNITALTNVSSKLFIIETNFTGSQLQLINGTSIIANITNTANLNLGVYNITAYFVGDENYTSSNLTRYLTIQDTTPPSISNVKITPKTAKPNSNVTIIATIDDFSNVSGDYLSVYNSSWDEIISHQNLSESGKDWFLVFNLSDLPEGVYYLNLTAADGLNNKGTAWVGNLTVNGTAGATNSFTNASVSMSDNQTVIDAIQSTNSTLQIRTNQPISNAAVAISSYAENPGNANIGVPALNKYLEITTSSDISSSLSWAIVKIYYNDSDIPSGYNENNMRIYYYNETSGSWDKYDGSLIGGVNITGKYVWANTTHFSTYGIFIEPTCNDGIQNQGETGIDCGGPCSACSSSPPNNPPASSGGGGGGGGGGTGGNTAGSGISTAQLAACLPEWSCSDWSSCANNLQTRSCNDKNSCNTTQGKPSLSQACIQSVLSENKSIITPSTAATPSGPTGFFLGVGNTTWYGIIIGLAIIGLLAYAVKKGRIGVTGNSGYSYNK